MYTYKYTLYNTRIEIQSGQSEYKKKYDSRFNNLESLLYDLVGRLYDLGSRCTT